MAVPANTDHAPVPTVGVLPANVAVLTPQAGFISVPALAVVGRADTATVAVVELALAQTPLVTTAL